MTDVKALEILSAQIGSFRNLPNPPTNLDKVDAYTDTLKQTSKAAENDVAKVKTYNEQIVEKLNELRTVQKDVIERNQDAIQHILETIKVKYHSTANTVGGNESHGQPRTSHDYEVLPDLPVYSSQQGSYGNTQTVRTHGGNRRSQEAFKQMKAIQSLAQASKDLMNNRVNELINEAELVCGKVQDGADLSQEDINGMKGCLDSWRGAKEQSHAEEKRAEADAIRRQQEAERRRQVDEARRKQEEANKKKREEEERNRKKQEEAERQRKQKEEADRARKEEAERLKKAEEERQQREAEEKQRRKEEERRKREEARLKREEEERLRIEEEVRRVREEEERRRIEEERKLREEEERRQREAEEKRLREEEEARRKEEERRKREEADRKRREERLRREKERKEKERLQREAEEKARRCDPNNWKPVVYERHCDEVDGRREYHGGIKCVLASPEGGIQKDDIECYASDEIDSVITVLEEDEKPVSSMIDVQSGKESLHSEVPSRVYIPHSGTHSASDEVVVKISKNGSEWTTVSPVHPTSNMLDLEKTARIVGVEVNDFTTLKLIVISRPKSQVIIVDRPGVSVYSAVDNQVKLFVPRDSFDNETQMRMMVQPVSGETFNDMVKDDTPLENVLSVSPLITLVADKAPRKTVEVDLLKSNARPSSASKLQRGKFCQLYACRDKTWRLADVGYKGQHNNVTVSIPAGLDRVTIMELEVPANVSKETLPSTAETIYESVNKTTAVLLVKQNRSNPNLTAVRIVRRADIEYTLGHLESLGFDEGPGVSGEFKIKEGQSIRIVCSGNIENNSGQEIKLQYISYRCGATAMLNLKVKDEYKQKDLPSFVGIIKCLLLKDTDSEAFTHSVEMTISLPKIAKTKLSVNFVKVRFPYYLTSLASYLAISIGKDETFNWKVVLKTLVGNRQFEAGRRNAKRKFENIDENIQDEAKMFKTILLDWMRSQPKQTDKLISIVDALIVNGYSTLAQQCRDYVAMQKVSMSDDVLKEIASNATTAPLDLGRELGLSDTVVEKCIQAEPGDKQAQIAALMIEWRESEDVIRHADAQSYLKHVAGAE